MCQSSGRPFRTANELNKNQPDTKPIWAIRILSWIHTDSRCFECLFMWWHGIVLSQWFIRLCWYSWLSFFHIRGNICLVPSDSYWLTHIFCRKPVCPRCVSTDRRFRRTLILALASRWIRKSIAADKSLSLEDAFYNRNNATIMILFSDLTKSGRQFGSSVVVEYPVCEVTPPAPAK